jgi:hypothetical protein
MIFFAPLIPLKQPLNQERWDIMPTSNEQVQEILDNLQPFYSQYTGDEVEQGIKDAVEVMSFLSHNVIVPAASLTGDYLSKDIVTITQDMWLESIVLYCNRAFSESCSNYTYEVATGSGARLVLIPTEFMTSKGSTLTYYINQIYPVDTTFKMVCSSTVAYGEILVKLNFR